jgi:regulator of sigma E protease
MIGEMRNAGLRAMLHLLAMVSISLAVANLLPIPGLDGGSIAMSLYEAIRGKPVQAKIYARFQMVGLALLVLLMILVITSDIRFLLGGM